MHLINDFINNTLPVMYHINNCVFNKILICMTGLGISIAMIEPLIDNHKKSPMPMFVTTAVVILISSIVGLFNTFKTYCDINDKYDTQISKIAKEYPYSIVINPDGDKSTVILEKTKPSKAHLDKIKQGKDFETNNDRIIISASANSKATLDPMKTSVLNHYSLNQRATKIIYAKTGAEKITKPVKLTL